MPKVAIITDLSDKVCPFCGMNISMPNRVCACCGATLEVNIYVPRIVQAALVSGTSGVIVWILCFLFSDGILDYVLIFCFVLLVYGLVQYKK